MDGARGMSIVRAVGTNRMMLSSREAQVSVERVVIDNWNAQHAADIRYFPVGAHRIRSRDLPCYDDTVSSATHRGRDQKWITSDFFEVDICQIGRVAARDNVLDPLMVGGFRQNERAFDIRSSGPIGQRPPEPSDLIMDLPEHFHGSV